MFPSNCTIFDRATEARQPRFPMELDDRTFELVANHLEALGYTDEVGLSCDDTKLTEGTRLYWDGKQKCHFLVGAVGGPIRVLDPEQMRDILEDPETIRAKKVITAFNKSYDTYSDIV